jgi:hypothetical protein
MLTDDAEIFESEDEEEEQKKNPEDRKRLFRRELAAMLYGFGDKKVSNKFYFQSIFLFLRV